MKSLIHPIKKSSSKSGIYVWIMLRQKELQAVNQVSLELKPQETLELAGESGCGKSTLAFAISRLHKMPALISQGEIFFKAMMCSG